MPIHLDKKQEHLESRQKDVPTSNNLVEPTFVDNRPETIAQLQMIDIANNSPKVLQMMQFQEMLTGSSKVTQLQNTPQIDTQPQTNTYVLNNGEVVTGDYTQEYIDGFNTLYDAVLDPDLITTDIWNFESYRNEESIIGNYTAHYIQDLDDTPEDYEIPDTFALSGIQPTYDAARLYNNPWGNCYSTTASRINKAYEDLYGVTPIDYTQNANGTFTSADYRTASTQNGVDNFGYGVGGALANGGEGELVDNTGVWDGDLKPGAALQIWHTTDQESIGLVGGHSQIFINYTYDENNVIDGMEVYDNSGAIETRDRNDDENNEIILAGNLLDQ